MARQKVGKAASEVIPPKMLLIGLEEYKELATDLRREGEDSDEDLFMTAYVSSAAYLTGTRVAVYKLDHVGTVAEKTTSYVTES